MILSLHIDGEWTARELAAVLDSIEALAGFVETGEIESMYAPGLSVDTSPAGISVSTPDAFPSHLKIHRLQYSSPGTIDLLGVAKVVEQVRLFLEFLINLWVLRNSRQLDLEERKIELAEKRAEVLLQLAERHPDLVKIVEKQAADALIEAVFRGQITSVDARKPDGTP